MRISLTLRGLYEQQWCTLTEPTINLAQTYTRRRVLQNVPGHPSQTHTNTHLVADGTDVIVLLELLVRSCRQALDLVDSISAEQETLPAQLGPQPHVIVRMDEYDGGAHHGPLPKHRLRHAVRHHAHRHQELQQPVGAVHPVDDIIHVLHRSLAQLLHHEEHVDQQRAQHLRVKEFKTEGQQLNFTLHKSAIITTPIQL